MREIMLIIFLFPILMYGQHKTVIFDCENIPVKLNISTVNTDLCNLLGVSSNFNFQFSRLKTNTLKTQVENHYTLQQFYNSYPVEGAEVTIHFRDSMLFYINGTYFDSLPNSINPISILETDAFQAMLASEGSKQFFWDTTTTKSFGLENITDLQPWLSKPIGSLVLKFIKTLNSQELRLVYKYTIMMKDPIGLYSIFIDANSNKVVLKESHSCTITGTADTRYSGQQSIESSLQGSIYILKDNTRGAIIHTKNSSFSGADYTDGDNNWTAFEYDNATKDNAALDAHWGAEMFYDYFYNIHNNRNGYNNGGGYMTNLVNYSFPGTGTSNAFWIGGGTTGYGSGDQNNDPFTSIDIVGHEYGHAMFAYETSTSPVNIVNEFGAIHEGLSDIWGACIENYATTNKLTWQVGEDFDINNGIGLRSLSNPKSLSNPDTYLGVNWCDYTDNNLQCTQDDAGGIHTNCTVMGHWFYLLSVGDAGINDNNHSYNVNGIGIANAAQIVYRAETVYMNSTTDFASARIYTIKAAQDLYGYCSPFVQSVINAWHAVGVGKSYQEIANQTISTNFTNTINLTFFAPNLLEASNLVGSNATISYQSTNTVRLLPGFKAETGANFTAKIIPCIDVSSAKKETDILPNEDNNYILNHNSVRISPNPATDHLNVLFSNEKLSSATISLIDLSGRVLSTFFTSTNFHIIDISTLISGVYFVKVVEQNNTYSKLIIKN